MWRYGGRAIDRRPESHFSWTAPRYTAPRASVYVAMTLNRLKVAICVSVVATAASASLLLDLMLGAPPLKAARATATVSAAALIAAAVVVSGFVDAVLRYRSRRRALLTAFAGLPIFAAAFLIPLGDAQYEGPWQEIVGVLAILFFSAPVTLPCTILLTLLWYRWLQKDAAEPVPAERPVSYSSWLLPRLVAAGLLSWGIATAWSCTVNGFLEPATLDVDYFTAGAGDDLLVVRAGLAFAIALLASLWACLPGTLGARLVRLALAPCILLVFYESVARLDRATPGYSEARFMQVVDAHQAGQQFSPRDVRARLGAPLIAEWQGDELTYSYTFTPSGGYGWKKRILRFDKKKHLISTTSFNEP